MTSTSRKILKVMNEMSKTRFSGNVAGRLLMIYNALKNKLDSIQDMYRCCRRRSGFCVCKRYSIYLTDGHSLMKVKKLAKTGPKNHIQTTTT